MPETAESGALSLWPRWQQWVVLVIGSLIFAGALEYAHFPAGLLMGPMLAGLLMGVNGTTVRVPQPLMLCAQAVIGCLIAASLSPASIPAFVQDWPLFLGVVLATLAGSSLLGWLISSWRVLPGTVGVWGSAPGAATAMVLMAGTFGADQRLVAFMQYFRIILVTATATIVARLWVGEGGDLPAMVWFPSIDWPAFLTTLGIAACGPFLGRLVRLPNPVFLGPMVLGIALKFSGIATFQLPEWLLALSYMLVGWSIGLRFTRQTLQQMRRALPMVTLSIIALIVFCGLIGVLLWRFAGVDPLTAYLATSPGGMDSVAVIAAASGNVDISFIMALQLLRFAILMVFGPSLARMVARLVKE